MIARPPIAHLLALFVVVSAAVGCGVAPAAIQAAAPTTFQAPENPRGRIAYVRDGNLWIWQSGEVRQLTEGGTWRQPSFSPDGSEIAYVYREQNFADIFVMAADGSSSRRLTRGQAPLVSNNDWTVRPAWAGDGEQIAFVSDVSSPLPLLWTMSKDGGNRRQIFGNAGSYEETVDAISWAPDGKHIAITWMPLIREVSQIFLVDIAKGSAEKFTNHPRGAFDPSWSPNGEVIAYVGREGAKGDLWLRRVDGPGDARSDKLAFVRSPVWSPDGKHIAVLSAQTGSFELWVASVDIDGDKLSIGDFRQLTRDGGVDAASGLSWAK
jgi:TolB protein